MSTPTAFDTSLGNNFTQLSCPQFFQSFLNDANFVQCYPMSFFLRNSRSYITTVRAGFEQVEAILDLSCAASEQDCTNLMASYADQLVQENVCQADLQLENPLVTQAYSDFRAYNMVRQATCLTLGQVGDSYKYASDPSANAPKTSYCYTKALYNYNDSADAFLYLLPFGTPYPSTGYDHAPSCSNCNNQVMSIFHSQTDNQNLSIVSSYDSAGSVLAQACGADFVNGSSILSPSNVQSPYSATTTTHTTSAAARLDRFSLISLLLFISLLCCI